MVGSTRTGVIRAMIVFLAVGLLIMALIAPATQSTPPADTTPVPTRELDYAPVSSHWGAGILPTPPPSRSPASPLAPPWNALPPDPVGTQVTINGEPATICIHGDGWGTTIWAGNAHTSCGFVIAVHEELIRGLNPTYDNIRHHLKPQITATSPATGLADDMTCRQVDRLLLTCTGGDNAAVYFY